MKVLVLGPGSMGLLYGAKLSKEADVCLIGRNEENIRAINECGVTVKRGGEETLYHPEAALGGQVQEPADLIILFTKAYITTNLSDAVVFAVLIIVLLVKPAGLLGKYVPEKV